MQFSMILVVLLVPLLAAAEKQVNESGQYVSREEFQALKEQLTTCREETAAVRREVDSWQNSTILILKHYLIENPNDVKTELQQLKNQLKRMKQEMIEEHILTRNTSLKDEVNAELQQVKDELQQMKQEMREDHITTRNTSLEGIEGCVSLVTENIHNMINTAHNNTLEELKQSAFQCQPPDIGSHHNPAASCKYIAQSVIPSASRYYWIGNSSVHARRAYCDMTRRCCDNKGGWMRVADLNMTTLPQNCPQGFRTITSPRRLCGRQRNPGCASTAFPVHGVSYQKVCGRIIGYQDESPNAFEPYYKNRTITIDDTYIDGVSITHGRNPRKHIWSFAAALDETRFDSFACPCTMTDASFTGVVPPFVGQDYFCDTGSRYHYQHRIYSSDPLWDGSGCGSTSSCCRFNSPPWFCKQLPQPTTDDIELRLCGDQSTSNEDALIELVELYVQ